MPIYERMGLLLKATKSRTKNKIISILKSRNLLRLLLICSLFLYLPGAVFFPNNKNNNSLPKPNEKSENGMGGGVVPEGNLALLSQRRLPEGILETAELDFELLGVPEPEEYSRPRLLTFSAYTMEKGDIIGNIAERTGLNEDTLISVNDVKNTRLMQIGQVIKIPNQDGIYYTIKTGDSLESIAEKYETSVMDIKTVNELFSNIIVANTSLFIPGARLDWVNRQEINGDLFIWPISGYITSNYGYRLSPFDGVTRQFHSGLDLGSPSGTPIKAAMSGRVIQIGNDDSFGNYVVISHHSGYRTLYAHMSVIRVKAGAYVDTGQRIGDVGMTGAATGPHLHFTVYKNGITVNPRSLMK